MPEAAILSGECCNAMYIIILVVIGICTPGRCHCPFHILSAPKSTQTTVRPATYYGSSFSCTSSLQCEQDRFVCDASTNCSLECLGENACYEAVLQCPENAGCYIECYQENACREMQFNGGDSTVLSIDMPYNPSYGDRLDYAVIFCPTDTTLSQPSCYIQGVASYNANQLQVYSMEHGIIDRFIKTYKHRYMQLEGQTVCRSEERE